MTNLTYCNVNKTVSKVPFEVLIHSAISESMNKEFYLLFMVKLESSLESYFLVAMYCTVQYTHCDLTCLESFIHW